MGFIALCDDREAERKAVCRLLCSMTKLRQDFRLEVIEYGSGESLLLDLETDRWDFQLVLLDIVMKPLSGMETARQIRAMGRNVPIAFLTTSPDYALESYDVGAAGYLLKPVAQEKLAALLRKVLTPPDKPRVCVQAGRRRRYLFLEEIAFAESDNHSIRIHLTNGEKVVCGGKLGDLAALERLPAQADRKLEVQAAWAEGRLVITVGNTCSGTVALGLNGLPASTKQEQDHGFGLLSIQQTVRRYGGWMDVEQQENRFLLRMVLKDEEPG